ncbi:MAG: aminotransferase class V-fold PLP-dependent enzyme [Candidatus Hadarchaeales archaeon]
MEIESIRRDFPIISSGIIYMDNAASSLTPEPVIQKILEFYREYRANVERGIHRLSVKATAELEEAREKIRKFLNARNPSEIVFTKNTTEALNIIANGVEWKKGQRIVTTLLEHHSNYIIWQRIAKKFGLKVEVVYPNQDGLLEVESFERAIDEKTRLVAVAHVSNVLGTIAPVKEIAKIAHENGAEIVIDGAQSVPHLPVDVLDLDCDYLAFSGHKMLGPTGIGVLCGKEELLKKLEPPFIGGGTIEDVWIGDYSLAPLPAKFEAGTPPIAEAIALGAAVDYLEGIGMKEIAEHERKLTGLALKEIGEIPAVEIYGPKNPQKKCGIVAFNIKGMQPHDVASILDNSAKIMVRSGHHCAIPLHKEFLKRPEGSVRSSFYIYNTVEEVRRLASTLREIAGAFV